MWLLVSSGTDCATWKPITVGQKLDDFEWVGEEKNHLRLLNIFMGQSPWVDAHEEI